MRPPILRLSHDEIIAALAREQFEDHVIEVAA